MGYVKGQVEYEYFLKDGKCRSFLRAIKAHCYVCNGMEEGGVDCLGKNCPLYQYFPYKGKKGTRRIDGTEPGTVITRKEIQIPPK